MAHMECVCPGVTACPRSIVLCVLRVPICCFYVPMHFVVCVSRAEGMIFVLCGICTFRHMAFVLCGICTFGHMAFVLCDLCTLSGFVLCELCTMLEFVLCDLCVFLRFVLCGICILSELASESSDFCCRLFGFCSILPLQNFGYPAMRAELHFFGI